MKKIILSLLFAFFFAVSYAQSWDILATETAEDATTVTIQFKLIASSGSFLLGGVTIYLDQLPASLKVTDANFLPAPPPPYFIPSSGSITGYDFDVRGNLEFTPTQFSVNNSINGGPATNVTSAGVVLGTATFTKVGSGTVKLTIDQTNTAVVDAGFTTVNYVAVDPDPMNVDVAGLVVLPLEWLSFKATPITADGANKVALTWETASEKDVTNFNVERSDDGKVFTKIGAAIPANNKVTKSSYTAYDDKPLNGVSYYRIRQTDVDGKTSVTKIESVTLNSKKAVGKFTFYPNPIQKGTPLSILTDVQGAFDFKVIDMTGRVMYNQKLQGNTELKGLTLAGGTYLYEILSGEQRVSGKIFVAE